MGYISKRGRGRPNLTWEEYVKRDLKDWNITKKTSHGQGCVVASYPCARTMSWFPDLMSFSSGLPQLVWD